MSIEDKNELLASEFHTVDSFKAKYAADLIKSHPEAIAVQIDNSINTEKGVMRFEAVVIHVDHVCMHYTEIEILVTKPLPQDEDSKMPSTWDMMSASDREACSDAGRGPSMNYADRADELKKEQRENPDRVSDDENGDPTPEDDDEGDDTEEGLEEFMDDEDSDEDAT